MSRRRTSLIEDIVDLSAKLPWQASIVIAIVAYGVLHYIAIQAPPVVDPGALRGTGSGIARGVWSMIAGILQYLIPVAMLVGAGISFIRRRKVKDADGTLACPQCGSAMVLRTAKSGSNAGKSFWGCSQYPKCKGTRN
jgi:predicted RNA-binding Zn-ribbon protein involved in translation (DUF1610 family)